MWRSGILTSSSVFAMLAVGPALASSPFLPLAPGALPAVSTTNGKVGAFAGSIDDLTGGGVTGTITLPLDRSWGLQGDALAGQAGGNTFWGIAGQIFWRDPQVALLGLFASRVDWSTVGADVTKVGIEAELYQGPISLEGAIASQGGTFTGLAFNATVALYATPDLRLDATFRQLEGVGTIAGVGFEWQNGLSGVALFGSASFANSTNHSTLLAGARFYAGPPKTLIRRHREDDPNLPWDLFQVRQSCSNGPIDIDAPLSIPLCDGVQG